MENGLKELYAIHVLGLYYVNKDRWDYCYLTPEDPDEIDGHILHCDNCEKRIERCLYGPDEKYLGYASFADKISKSLCAQIPTLREQCETEKIDLSVHFLVNMGHIQMRGCDRHGFLKYCANTKDDIRDNELCLVLGLQIAGLSEEEIRKAIDVDRK